MKRTSTLPAFLEGFFTDRLIRQRQASPHTVAAYRDTFRLLLRYANEQLGHSPSALQIEHIDAPFIGRFLDYVEEGNCARTRNQRLAAIRSFFRYLAFEAPGHAALIQRVLAIPNKRHERALIHHLKLPEVEALLAAPVLHTWNGRRDHAMLVLDVQTGLRVSELTALKCQDISLKAGAHVRCYGKGRKERCTPLTKKVKAIMSSWMRERRGADDDPLFPNARGGFMSADGFQYILARHLGTAREKCPTLVAKRVSPHVLRHTAAMNFLAAGIDPVVIALWLGHESVETTQIYIDADLAMKEAALSKTRQPRQRGQRFRPDDDLMAFLKSL